MASLSQDTKNFDPSSTQTSKDVSRTVQYKRCTIHATSYGVGPTEWVPEAYFWKCTETGWRRFWVQNFEQFPNGRLLAFSNQRDADFQAFAFARALIDTISGDRPKDTSKTRLSWASCLAKLVKTS